MGRVVHFEIYAENPERAIDFYSKIFDWKFNKWEGPMDYWLIETGGSDKPGINGGMMRREGKIDGNSIIAYVCTIDVTNLDKTVEQVKTSGGTVHMPKSAIPGMGWYAYLKDTEGNVFGVMQDDTNAK